MKANMWKAVLAAMLVLTMILSGCGNKTVAEKPAENTEEPEEAAPEKEETAETEEDTAAASEEETAEETAASADEVSEEEGAEAEQGEEEMADGDMGWKGFLKDMGMGWNLGNTLDPDDCNWVSEMDYEGAWLPGGTKTTKEMILLAKDQGFRTIRIPVSWHNHVEITDDGQENKVYTINRQWMDRVKEVVNYAYEEGLYVIINIHHDDRTKNFIYPAEECREQSLSYITQIWTQVAEEFADYDTHLLFGTFNEVRLVGTADEWNPSSGLSMKAQELINEYGQAAVDAIRAVNKGYNEERYILCPGYAGSPDCYKKYVLPTDNGGYENRIIVEVHAYTPYNFCMDVSPAGSKSVFDKNVQSDVDWVFRTINTQWISKDIPVIITEWGCILKADNEEERIKHAQHYITQAMTACKDSSYAPVTIPCILWDNANIQNVDKGETFGYMDRQNVKWFDQAYVDAIINTWKELK